MAVFEGEPGYAGFVKIAEIFLDRAVELFCGARDRHIGNEIACQLTTKKFGDFMPHTQGQPPCAKVSFTSESSGPRCTTNSSKFRSPKSCAN